MITIQAIYDFLDGIAPFETAMTFDNCGLLVGDSKQEVTACVLALDMTTAALAFAVEQHAQLIITHHPVIFDPLKTVTADSIIYQLIQHNIGVLSAHTNLDLAQGGVNDALAATLSLSTITDFVNADKIGRVGKLPHPMTATEFAGYLKEHLCTPVVQFVDCGHMIETVAVIGGAGEDYLYDSRIADGYLTGEVPHHIYGYAQNAGIQLFTAGHYETEAVVLPALSKKLESIFADTGFFIYDKSDIQSV